MAVSKNAVLVSALTLIAVASAKTPKRPHPESAQLRVEGDTTIYEGPVLFPLPRNVTTPSGGTHPCDGTNYDANPSPGPTATSLLAQAAGQKRRPFSFDGEWESAFDDFFITSIGGTTQTANEFWGLLNDYQFTPTGGCQFEVPHGSQTLWAFNAFNVNHFLKSTLNNGTTDLGKKAKAVTGVPFFVDVIDGMNGGAMSGASVQAYDPKTGAPIDEGSSAQTDMNGRATITETVPGTYYYKAYNSNSMRSNRVEVHVKAAK